jgi:hypothetical protein
MFTSQHQQFNSLIQYIVYHSATYIILLDFELNCEHHDCYDSLYYLHPVIPTRIIIIINCYFNVE